MRILVAAHSWSLIHPGGAEFAAVNLARVLRQEGHEVLLAACAPHLDQDVGYDESQSLTLVRSVTDPVTHLWTEPRMAESWSRIIADFGPDIVHLHHYVNLGAELPLVAKKAVPGCTVVLTLHEYLAICAQAGQMVTPSRQLCSSSGPRKCAVCSSRPIERIVEPALTLKALFRHVDRFIAPSQFLRSRYIDWGLAPGSIVNVPNVVRSTDIAAEHPQSITGVTRFVFMSQHTPYKGLDVLLDALVHIQTRYPEATERILVEIWGDGIDRFGQAWTEAIGHRKAQLGSWVTFRGAYTPEQTGEIYARADWTVVPSIWWENRPLVIEESLMSGVPLIVSNIGGMAELVNDASRGRTCRPNDAVHLAETMIDVLAASPPTVRYRAATTAAEHLELYRSCLGPR